MVLVLIAIAISTQIGASGVTSWSGQRTARAILLDIRLPRICVALLVGAILAVAGTTFQTLLRNPLADPFILGVSGGAACGAALVTAVGWSRYPGVLPLVAFGGACSATAGVLLLARRGSHLDPVRLILSGLVLNAFFSALILLSLAVTRGSDLTAALRWMMGSFSSASWDDAALLAATFAVAGVVLTWIAGDLRMLVFGEEDARAHGVNTRRIQWIGFVTASLATGAAVAVSGIIGFVGLLVPHAIRLITRRDIRVLLPLSALGGGCLMLIADTIARVAIRPAELPVGALTAFLGVPFFFLILKRA